MSNEKAKNIFMDYLSKKGLRNTWQRLSILDTFLSSGKLMCECGLADEIKIGNKKTRYEQKAGHGHHDHLICTKCGKFIEIHDDTIERLQEKLAEANDFIPQRHKLEIYGLCKKCK